MAAPNPRVFRFSTFELDGESGELRRHGLKIRLPDQSFQILKTLLSRPGEVVTRDELRYVLWKSDTFVDFEVALNSAVRRLREALNDSAENPRFIETLPRRGYRFIGAAPVTASGPPPQEPAAERAVSPASQGPTAQTFVAPAMPVPVVDGGVLFPRRRAAGLLLVSLLAASAVLYQRGAQTNLGAEPVVHAIKSLVVLPFENLTGDPGQESLVDNITDSVTSHLAQIAGLDVISRTSARRYKQTAKPLPSIGSELNVDAVVEGAVAKSGTGVRITATLIRVDTDRQLWVSEYEGDVTQMLAVQRRIASDVATATGRLLPPTGGRPAPVIDAQAYQAYLKGVSALGMQRVEGIRTAVAYFEKAVAIQPDFGEAHASLALAQVQFLFGGPLSPREAIPKAERAARRALQLDETLGRAHWALGQILSLYHWQWEEGHRALRRAAELEGDDDLSAALSESWMRRGQFVEAIATAERGRRLDPLSFDAQVAVGAAYRVAGQYDRAVTEGSRAIDMAPAQNRGRFQLGVTFLAMGRPDEAIRELELAARSSSRHNSRMEAHLGYAYAAAGRTDQARQVLNELESHRRDQYVSSFGTALLHDALGEVEAALADLQQAYEDRAIEFARLHHAPPFKAVASHPQFLALMRQVGSAPQ